MAGEKVTKNKSNILKKKKRKKEKKKKKKKRKNPMTHGEFVTELNHRKAWVGRDPKDHQVPTPLLQAETPTSRSGTRPGPHPTWS